MNIDTRSLTVTNVDAPALPQKQVYIKTYGCQMNVYDSQRMIDILRPLGYQETPRPEDADLVILNTCHIREKAVEKVYSDLGRYNKRLKRSKSNQGKEVLIAVGGCVGQAEGEEIIKRAPYVDMVFGSQSYHHLPRLIHNAQQRHGDVVELDFPEVQKFDLLPRHETHEGVTAFVSVQEGCDKFCTFCVVPYTRGAEYSRPVAAVVDEVRALVEEQGIMDIMLLGQNVNAYHGVRPDGSSASLADLIAQLAEIDGLYHIRYTTSHPKDMRDDLIDAHGSIMKLSPYLHLPIQAGSDRILKAMNRQHTAAHYIDIMDRLRTRRPDIAFSGDFIVGFPSETEDDFRDTLRVIETVGYASAYSFAYSPRPGTPAAEMSEHIEQEVKEERLARLQALINRQQVEFNQRAIGQEMEVIFDRVGKYDGQAIGRSPWMQSVHVANAQSKMHQRTRVRIVEAHANSLMGELL